MEINILKYKKEINFWLTYLRSQFKFIIIFLIIGTLFGYLSFRTQITYYKSKVLFTIEANESSSDNTNNILASQIGFSGISKSNNIFDGSNIQDLMTSRSIIEKALGHTIILKNQKYSLIDYYILNVMKIKSKKRNKNFGENFKIETLDSLQKSIFNIIFKEVTSSKKLAFLSLRSAIKAIEVRSEDELFAKTFSEAIVSVTSDMYSEIKTKKLKDDLFILQLQADSIRKSLNGVIYDVASTSDQIFNLNSAFKSKGANVTKKSIDIQVNTSILYSLITNIEMIKLNIRKLDVYIKIIDPPTLPLETNEVSSKWTYMIYGAIISFVMSILFLIFHKFYKNLISQ